MKIAAIQMVSSSDLKQNLAHAFALMEQARNDGAELLVLPEYWPLMGMHDSDKLAVAERFSSDATPDTAVIQQFLAESARTLDAWIVGGTLPLKSEVAGKVMNSCLVYNRLGELQTRYDKIHLFGFQKAQESYDESQTIVAGTEVVTFESEFGRVGLSICYDLRFPELYRAMGECALLVVPAAFTYTTGQAHWEILLRARAIENQCYVLAAAQGACMKMVAGPGVIVC